MPRRRMGTTGWLVLGIVALGLLGLAGGGLGLAQSSGRDRPLPRPDVAVRELYDRWDEDGDGLVREGEGPSKAFFRELDVDRDGTITMAESQRYLDRWRGGPARPTVARYDVDKSPVPVEAIFDVAYRGSDDVWQMLDIFTPTAKAPAAGRPVVVMIHGGGWIIGDKGNPGITRRKVPLFVSAGMIYVPINYRLSPRYAHPAHVMDVAAAIAWLRRNITEYGGDPERIFVMGHSSGAHLTALVSTDEQYLAAHDETLQAIAGAILLDSAAYDIPKRVERYFEKPRTRTMIELAFGSREEVWVDASPVRHVASGKGIPPFLIFHVAGRRATKVISEEFDRELHRHDLSGEVIPVQNRDHSSLNSSIGKHGDPVTARILDFIAESAPAAKADDVEAPTTSPDSPPGSD